MKEKAENESGERGWERLRVAEADKFSRLTEQQDSRDRNLKAMVFSKVIFEWNIFAFLSAITHGEGQMFPHGVRVRLSDLFFCKDPWKLSSLFSP